METSRITQGIRFDTGIRTADWSDKPVGQTAGRTQGPLLPGSTTVSEAMTEVFPTDRTVGDEIFAALAAEASSPRLRTSSGFRAAAGKTIRSLRGRKGRASEEAARELEALLADGDLLDHYRAALLET